MHDVPERAEHPISWFVTNDHSLLFLFREFRVAPYMHTADDTRKYKNIVQAPQFDRKNTYDTPLFSAKAAMFHPNQ